MLPDLLDAGVATAIGSLPHHDPHEAAAFVLRTIPELPAVPQLPSRSPAEGMIAQWARGIPEVTVAPDGSLVPAPAADPDASVAAAVDPATDASLLAFLDVAASQPRVPRSVKVQVTGPLTLATSLLRSGLEPAVAFRRGAEASRAWARALERAVTGRLPGATVVCFFDEPALVQWAGDDGPLPRDDATDLLSGVLAGVDGLSGVHVCGQGDVRLALDAGPQVLGIDVAAARVEDGIALSRFLDGGGWLAWGAVPTDRPIGEQVTPLWKSLMELWCELTRRGCDPIRLRSQALVTPACGLAGHGVSQAERALRLARELGARVHDQVVATRLSIGA